MVNVDIKFWKKIFPQENPISILVIATVAIAVCHSKEKH